MTVEGDKLHGLLMELKKRIDAVERGTRTPQLPNSSVDVNSGRGYIPFLDQGEERAVLGRRPDGTVTLTHVSSPVNPIIPLAPTVTPLFGGLEVTCTGFDGEQYEDFSHVNVYCDNQLIGSIIKVPGTYVISPLTYTSHNIQLCSVNLAGDQSSRTSIVSATPNKVVGTDILNGIIDELKLADDAVTAAKIAVGAVGTTEISDNSISTPKIIAQAITTALIASEAVTAGKIAAHSITAGQIQALAITADEIAANAITSGKITAGSVTADKLAAQIVLATTAFIAGDPLADRLIIDSTGITQYDEAGNIVLQIGSSPVGNSFTVLTTGNIVLAALDSSGVLSASGLKIQDPEKDSFTINGTSFYDVLDNMPKGIIARGFTGTGNAFSTTGEIGVAQLKVPADGTRILKACTNIVYKGSGTVAAELSLKVDLNDTRPTTSSTRIGGSGAAFDIGSPLTIKEEFLFAPNSGHDYLWFLVTLRSVTPGSSVGLGYYGNLGLVFWIEDLGSAITASNLDPLTGTAIYTKTYYPTWTRGFGSDISPTPDYLYQGGVAAGSQYFGAIGFDSTTIQSDLSGATVVNVELFLHNENSMESLGTTVHLGTHNASSAPGSYPGLSTYGQANRFFSKGSSIWIRIPNVSDSPTAGVDIWAALKNGTIKGFTTDAGYLGYLANTLGTFTGGTSGTNIPALRITYAK